MKKKFHKLRPTNQKFHKLRPTKNKIDWSTIGSETKWWHWDLASLPGSDLESSLFGWTRALRRLRERGAQVKGNRRGRREKSWQRGLRYGLSENQKRKGEEAC